MFVFPICFPYYENSVISHVFGIVWVAGPCRHSLTEHLRWLLLDFRGSKYFFYQLNLVFIADSCTGFCSEFPWKHELKPQKQPLELFKKRCSKKFCKFHGKTIALKSVFNRAAGLSACNFNKKRLQHRFFPVEFTKLLRTPNLRTPNLAP